MYRFKRTYKIIGIAVKNLRVVVNCSPSSICSQCVRRRPASFSMENQGAPLIMCRKYKWAYLFKKKKNLAKYTSIRLPYDDLLHCAKDS